MSQETNFLESTFQDLVGQLVAAHHRELCATQDNFAAQIRALNLKVKTLESALPSGETVPLNTSTSETVVIELCELKAQGEGRQWQDDGVSTRYSSGDTYMYDGDSLTFSENSSCGLKNVWTVNTSGKWGPYDVSLSEVDSGSKSSTTHTAENRLSLTEKSSLGNTRCFINPTSRSHLLWDMLGLALILYDVIMVPYRWAFESKDTISEVVIDWFTLQFWTLDMAQGFFLAYYKKGLYITDNRRIVINYMKTGFCIDCLVVLPEWCLILLDYSAKSRNFGELGKVLKGARSVKVFRLMRAVRMVRMFKFQRIVARMHDFIQNEHTFIMLSLFQLIGSILICNHVVACVWYAIGYHYWHSGKQSWLDAHEAMQHSVHYRYATSLHWSMTQFTPAGMGVSATNYGERIFSLCVLVFAMLCFSSLVGGITSSMTQLQNLSHNENKQRWRMRLYMKQNEVPSELASRIIKHIEHQQQRKKNYVQEENLQCLKELSPELCYELKHQVFAHQLLLHPFFVFVEANMKSVIWSICRSAVTSQSFAQNEEIFSFPRIAEMTFFLKAGELEYVPYKANEVEQPLVPPPDIREPISEAAVWTEWRHQGKLVALVPTELICLNPDAFSKAMSVHPQPWFVAVNYGESFMTFLNELEDECFLDILRNPDFFDAAVKFCAGSQWRNRHTRSSLHDQFDMKV